jgi:HEAT repeat protein
MEAKVQTDPDEDVRASVVRSLEKFPSELGMQIFGIALKDSSAKVRQAVIASVPTPYVFAEEHWLTSLNDQDETVLHELLKRLAKGFDSYRSPLEDPLLQTWELPVNRLRSALNASAAEVRIGSVLLLGVTKALTVSEVQQLAREETKAVRLALARAVSYLDVETAIPVLLTALNDTSAEVRTAVMSAINKVLRTHFADYSVAISDSPYEQPPPNQPSLDFEALKLTPALLKALSDKDWRVRSGAALGLQYFDGEEVFNRLAEAADDRQSSVRRQAIESIARSRHPRAGKILIAKLRDSDAEVRALAATMLAGHPSDEAFSALVRGIRDRIDEVRGNVIRSLSMYPASQSASILRKALMDKRVRAYAALALARVGSSAFIPEVLTILETGPPAAQISAMILLSQSKVEAAIPTIQSIATRSPSQSMKGLRAFFGAQTVDLRPYAIVALTKLQSTDALPTVLNLTDNETDMLSAARAWAVDQFSPLIVSAALISILKNLSVNEQLRYAPLIVAIVRVRRDREFVKTILDGDAAVELQDAVVAMIDNDVEPYYLRDTLDDLLKTDSVWLTAGGLDDHWRTS